MVGDSEVSLLAILETNMDDVAEVRGFNLPGGLYHFRVDEAVIEAREAKGTKKAAGVFKLKVLNVLQILPNQELPADFDPSSLIDKTHTEIFFITDPVRDLGTIKAFVADIGAHAGGGLRDMVMNTVGTEFQGIIKVKPSKDDPDVKYVNLIRNKLKPVAA
jgi:hypothetical protein